MPYKTNVIEEHSEFQVVEVLDPNLGPRRYFAQKDGQIVTKGYVSAEAVRIEMEIRGTKAKINASDWLSPPSLAGILPGTLITYPLGRAMLLALTLGRYPRGKHNRLFVACVPSVLLMLFFASLAVVFS